MQASDHRNYPLTDRNPAWQQGSSAVSKRLDNESLRSFPWSFFYKVSVETHWNLYQPVPVPKLYSHTSDITYIYIYFNITYIYIYIYMTHVDPKMPSVLQSIRTAASE